MKRIIEMEDNLNEIVEEARQELRERFADVKNTEDVGELIFEIADSSTPVYTKEIEDLYYLHSDKFDEAYEGAGIGSGKEENHKQVCIFVYIEQCLWDFFNDELSK